ncbi:MAG: TIGR02147 family protein [Chitinophagaceae bacterium]|nr:TIGR02147 family protein [Oligoflexus sp.]
MVKHLTNIEKATRDVKPSSYLDYRLFLKAIYMHCKESVHSYSYQKYADDLGFSGTTVMHQIVNGYRPLTLKAAKRVAGCFSFEAEELKYFIAMVSFSNAKSSLQKEVHFQELQSLKRSIVPDEIDKSLLDYFSHWYHPVIWELIGTRGFKNDVLWICKKITPALKPALVEESIELLLKLELINYDKENDTYRQTKNRVTTGHRIKGLALVSYHSSMIDHAKNSLTSMNGSRRDVSAITLSVNEETAQKIRGMIHAFQLQLLDEAERCEASDQVYQVNIQLFPFTE